VVDRAASESTLGAAVDLWLAAVRTQVDRSTAYNYELWLKRAMRYLEPNTPVQDIRSTTIIGLYRDMERDEVSRSSQASTGQGLRQLFNWLVEMGMIQHSPADVPLPRVERKEVKPMRAEQLASLLKAAEGNRLETLYWLAADSGARQGELFALTAGDVYLRADGMAEISITKSLQRWKGASKIKPVKTDSSRRRVLLTSQTATKIRPLLKSGPDTTLFTNTKGGHLAPTNFYRDSWSPLLKRARLPHFRFHDLRHTCATLLLLANVHPKVVSERLGHSSIEMTLDTYSHLIPTMQRSATEALERLLPKLP
jgi:integrase